MKDLQTPPGAEEAGFYTVQDLQRLMNLSRHTIYKMVDSPGFPRLRMGKIIRIPKKEFHVWWKKTIRSQTGFRDFVP